MKYLAPSRLKIFWDNYKTEEIIGLSSGATPKYAPNSKYKYIKSPLRTHDDHIKAVNFIKESVNELIDHIYPHLNSLHKTDNSEKFWRIIIGPWLMLYTSVIYERYLRLTVAKKQLSELTFLGVSPPPLPYDTNSFIQRSQTCDIYNAYLSTRIASFLKIRTKTIKVPPVQRDKQYQKISFKSFLHESLNISSLFIFNLFSKHLEEATFLYNTGFNRVTLLKAFNRSRHKIVFLSTPQKKLRKRAHRNNSLRFSFRSHINKIKPTSHFMRAALTLLPDDFPAIFIEDFTHLNRQADRHFKKLFFKNVVASSSWHGDDLFKTWAANNLERGAKAFALQHGGDYGLKEPHIQEWHERKIANTYLTWGWSGGTAKSFITQKNTSSRKKVKREKKKILYVTDDQPRFAVSRLMDYEIAIREQLVFLKNLNQRELENTYIRFPAYCHQWGRQNLLKDYFPKLNYANVRQRFETQILDFELYITDHLSTTYLEAMLANTPTVIYINESLYSIRREHQEIFQELQDKKVIHLNPKSAANWVGEIYEDPSPWWRSRECQNIVKLFTKQFIKKSEKPEKIISDFFSQH